MSHKLSSHFAAAVTFVHGVSSLVAAEEINLRRKFPDLQCTYVNKQPRLFALSIISTFLPAGYSGKIKRSEISTDEIFYTEIFPIYGSYIRKDRGEVFR